MNDPLDYIFINSAREMWLLDWRIFRDPWSTRKQRWGARNRMKRNRRQAALERALAAANRRIGALELELYNNQEKSDRLMEELKESIIDQNNQHVALDDVATLKTRIEELEADLEEYQIQEYQIVFPMG